jgi:hypothetical protein
MKKLLLSTLIVGLLLSCKKEDIQPNEPEPTPLCNCGTIMSSGTSWGAGGLSSWVKVKNECSGKIKEFWVDYNQNLTAGSWWCEEKFYSTW